MLSNGPVYLAVYLPEVPHRADKPLERLSFGNASPHHPAPCFQDVLLGLNHRTSVLRTTVSALPSRHGGHRWWTEPRSRMEKGPPVPSAVGLFLSGRFEWKGQAAPP